MILTKIDGEWVPAKLTSYTSEKRLQDLLADDPSLIPGGTGSAVVREFHLPGTGYVDLVLVDDAGMLTVIECKLHSNNEIKRKVVGQVLEYASALWQMSYEDFERAFTQRTGAALLDSVRTATGGQLDESAFREGLTASLQEGRFRLAIAVDQITDGLRSTIEYLNAHTTAGVAVMGLEFGYFRQGDVEVLVPSSHGAEVVKHTSPSPATPGRRRWTEQDVRDAVDGLTDCAGRELLQSLLGHVTARAAAVKPGTAAAAASAGFHYRIDGRSRSVWSLYMARPQHPAVVVNLGSIADASLDRATRVLALLRTIPAFARRLSEDDQVALTQYPEAPLPELSDLRHRQTLLEAVTEATADVARPGAAEDVDAAA